MNLRYTILFVFITTVFAALLSSSTSNAQTTMTFTPIKDNTLFFSTDGNASNGAGPHFLVGNNRVGNTRRGILAFDLSSIAQGATVSEVTLSLNVSNARVAAQDIGLHRVLADWGEAGSMATGTGLGQPAPAQTGDASWLHRFYDTVLWAARGGDFAGIMSASQSVGGVGSYTWGSTAEMVADVQLWVDNPDTNFGWIVIGNESENQTAKRFDTKENTVESNRPMLTVTYTDPTSVENPEGLPEKFALAQNFPNPFNPGTVINYTIPQSVHSTPVKLEIFNLLGQRVKTLVNAKHIAGQYSVQWDGINDSGQLVSSGIYIYRLQAGSFTDLKKMTFMR